MLTSLAAIHVVALDVERNRISLHNTCIERGTLVPECIDRNVRRYPICTVRKGVMHECMSSGSGNMLTVYHRTGYNSRLTEQSKRCSNARF